MVLDPTLHMFTNKVVFLKKREIVLRNPLNFIATQEKENE
jgi:hypothetical protein